MVLDDTAVVQENTGSVFASPAATGAVVTLPAGTTAGSTLIAAVRSGSISAGVTLPSGWVLDGSVGSGSALIVARKSNVAAGETSWTFTAPAVYSWAWYVCEVAGLDSDPLDAVATGTGGGVTATFSATRTTGTTGASGGMDTVEFACFGSQGGVQPGVWSAYSTGYTEAGQVGVDGDGTAAGQAVAVARRYSGGAATGPFTASATVTAGAVSIVEASGLILAYRSATSPVVGSVAWQLGFEQGTHNGLGGSVLGATGIVNVTGTVGTDVIVQASSARAAPSGYGCRLIQAGAAKYLTSNGTSTTAKQMVVGLDLRVVSATGLVVLGEIVPLSGSALQVVYDATTSKIGVRWGTGGTASYQAGTTPTGTWVWLDFAFTGVTTATWHADWSLDSSPQTSPADLTGQSTGTGTSLLRIGANAAQTVTLDVDNIVISSYASAYPLGPHALQAITVDPASTPTVSGTVGNFALVTSNATGAALTSGTLTSARDAIDELPPVISASSDGVVQTTTAASDYLQFPMAAPTVPAGQVVAGVRLYACLISTTGAGAGNLGIRGWDGTTEASLVALSAVTPGSSTTVSSSIPPWATAMWNPVGGWTAAKIDAAALRVGFSGDATPDMGVHAVYLEVATRAAVSSRQLSVEDDRFTVDVAMSPYTSASLSYVITNNDPTRGATFDYSLAGVPQTPVTVGPSSSSTVDVAVDLFGDVSGVTLTPDPA